MAVRSRLSTVSELCAFWRDPSRPVNDDGAEVVHVGVGRSGGEKVPQGLKERARIVVCKKGGGIEAACFGAGHRFAINQCTRGIGCRTASAVGAVGVASEPRNGRHPRQCNGKREGIFLVWA